MQHMIIPFMELKMDSAANSMLFSGYGAAFNNIDSYGDMIAPGAFSQFLSDTQDGKQPWPSMLSQHGAMGLTSEDMTPIGVWTSLSEDGKGLISSGELANTQRGQEMHTLMSMKPRPAIDGLSIGYVAKKFDPRTKPDEPRRTLREIVLMEISPVTFPANRNARVSSVKSLEEVSSLSDIEEYLREAGGFSRGEAKLLIKQVKGINLREADGANEYVELAKIVSKNISILKG